MAPVFGISGTLGGLYPLLFIRVFRLMKLNFIGKYFFLIAKESLSPFANYTAITWL